ncbi:hypothetical protein KAH94_00370, partial [bacterium]|nr:hypothetical protein [bacterium]
NKYVGYNADVTNLTKLIERKLDDSMKNNESKKHKESEKILNQTLEKLYKIHKNNENLFKKNETILSDIICVAKERIIKKIKLLEKYNLNITSYKDINFKKIIELYPILINLTIDNITLFIADEQMKINNDKKKQKSLNRAIDIKKEENKQRKKEKCQNRNKLIKKGILYSTAVAITGVAGYCAVKKPAETGAFLHKTKTFFTTMWQNITNYFTDKK